MPELPEVESIRMYLEKQIVGKKLTSLDILEKKMLVGNSSKIINQNVSAVLRSGKVLSIKFENNMFASFHLKLSGQILYSPDKNKSIFKNTIPRANTNTMPGKTTRIILYFEDNSAVYFNDMRKFGWMKIGEKPEYAKGVDVLDENFSYEYFENAISKTIRPIKVVLMDQEKIAGIGNIYANDSLYIAKIHPARKSSSLTSDEKNILYKSIVETINEGLKYKGSSAHDELYMLPNSEKGTYQHHFKAYHQHGKACVRCGTIMERTVVGGRGTFFCPSCQKII
jgi:formamidopyrimidine-DNA glycosylase